MPSIGIQHIDFQNSWTLDIVEYNKVEYIRLSRNCQEQINDFLIKVANFLLVLVVTESTKEKNFFVVNYSLVVLIHCCEIQKCAHSKG